MIHAIIKIGSTDKATPAPAPKKDKEEKKGKK